MNQPFLDEVVSGTCVDKNLDVRAIELIRKGKSARRILSNKSMETNFSCKVIILLERFTRIIKR